MRESAVTSKPRPWQFRELSFFDLAATCRRRGSRPASWVGCRVSSPELPQGFCLLRTMLGARSARVIAIVRNRFRISLGVTALHSWGCTTVSRGNSGQKTSDASGEWTRSGRSCNSENRIIPDMILSQKLADTLRSHKLTNRAAALRAIISVVGPMRMAPCFQQNPSGRTHLLDACCRSGARNPEADEDGLGVRGEGMARRGLGVSSEGNPWEKLSSWRGGGRISVGVLDGGAASGVVMPDTQPKRC